MLIYLQMIETPEDRSKFETLYEEYRDVMYAVAKKILRNNMDAEDALHQAFVNIAENMEKISESLCPKTKSYSDEVVATADYYYDNDGKLVMVRDLTSGYVVDYAYDGQRVRSVKELANSNTEGQFLELSYRQQYTEIRSSGSDDLYGNDDDIVNAYIFDDENRLVSCYSMNAMRTMIYGAASGEYETQENVKNNIKTSTTVGGTASSMLLWIMFIIPTTAN